ncbi:MAG TPA: TonB-dependent receptor [Bryobacteraceae bacterium]|nr:TonB-dependent receptor [Bryobacteraceae bacterium]
MYRLLCAAIVMPLAIYAQRPSGEIRLQVNDPSGAAVRVSGKLKNIATGEERSFETDDKGAVRFSGLAFGRYAIQIAKAGFAAQTISIDIKSSSPVTRVVKLALRSEAYKVEVVATTPLAGSDLSIDQIAAPVQTAGARDFENSGSLDLADLMNRRLNSVNINENQENPFQPDVNYRGYTASPLLGTPEGLSVYMDGVRQNQPFGDIVAWDLIPKIAIQEVALMPGSDPLYGLNTLGGAVSIQTKDGASYPGTSIEVTGGMYGRRAAEFEHGGASSKTGWSWYVAGNLYREDGWRQDSPSEVRQSFAKLAWSHGKTALAMSFGYADNWLTGNGTQDFRFLEQNYASVYSIPDITWNHSPSWNFTASHAVTSRLKISGNAYFRYIRSDTDNADINSNSFDQPLYDLSAADVQALTAAGYSGFPVTGSAATEPFPSWLCIAQALEKADPSDTCTGIITRTYTKENNYGAAGQATWLTSPHGQTNHLTIGAAWDRSSMTFQQFSQFGFLNADRITVTPVDAFADGSTSSGGVPVDTRVNLHGLIGTPGVFAADTLSLGGKWNLTVSGRYNRTAIDNADRLPPDLPARGSLNGDYVFGRFNPAAGLTYAPWGWLNVYASYSESSRAPTAIELGCADPNYPCNLPNALVSDPPLKQVVTRTVDLGARGSADEGHLRWSAGWFRGENHNDLLFVASPQTGFGYFANFGQTRREGAEANLSGRIRRLTLGGGYNRLNATYQSAEVINGGDNSSADASGNIAIQPGDRIPLIPQNMLKAYGDFDVTRKISLDLDFVAAGRSFARGNENNQDQPDGVYYLGPGYSPGYGVLNFGAHYQVLRRLRLFVEINNLLDHHYYSAAQLGPTPFDNSGAFVAQPFPETGGNYPIRTTTFFAPGAPINVFGGMRFTF